MHHFKCFMLSSHDYYPYRLDLDVDLIKFVKYVKFFDFFKFFSTMRYEKHLQDHQSGANIV